MAAQKKAEELVAKIRSEKEAKEAASPVVTDAPETLSRPSVAAVADSEVLNPERTPQVPTPGRPATDNVPAVETRNSSSVATEAASTVVVRNKPSLRAQLDTVDSAVLTAPLTPSRRVVPVVGGPRNGSVATAISTTPPPSPGGSAGRSRTGPPSRTSSPLRKTQISASAANAIEMANAAIASAETARRNSRRGSMADDDSDTAASNGVGSAVYIPTSNPTSPASYNSIGQNRFGDDFSPTAAATTSPSSADSRDANLDLRTNDSAFYVMANMIAGRLMPKLAAGETSYTLDENDRIFFDKMLPHTVRWSFVDALRYRREGLRGDLDEIPIGGESTTDELARKCCWLGLDRPEELNVLLQPNMGCVHVGQPDFAREVMQRLSATASGSSSHFVSADAAEEAPSTEAEEAHLREEQAQSEKQRAEEEEARLREQQAAEMERQRIEEQEARLREEQAELEKQRLQAQQQLYKEQVELQKQQIESQKAHINLLLDASMQSAGDGSVVDRSMDTAESNINIGPLDDSIDGRARQQIISELNEARAMLNSAKTPEATNFWKAHVRDLEGRLQELGLSVPLEQPLEQHQMTPVSPMSSAHERPGDAVSRSTGTQQIPAMPQLGASGSRSVAPPAQNAPPALSPAPTVPPTYQPIVYDGLPMVDVIAPADLPAGYTFEAQMGSKRFLATVPPGGVRRGDRFTCPMKSLDRVEIQAPTGRWRDGIFDIFHFGALHPLVLNAIFIPLIAVGQIMSRNHLTWFGDHSSRFQSLSVFTNMLMVVLCWGALNLLFLFMIGVTFNRGHLPSYLDYVALGLVNAFMLLFSIYAVARTRGEIRSKFRIPAMLTCGGGKTEDYLCATFCMPCTITQMGRHTADFDTYRAVCCSGTGLPSNVDVVPEPLSSQGANTHILDDSHFV